MEREYFAAQKNRNLKIKDKKYLDAKKSLNNYIKQLKFHYNLTDGELSGLIKEISGSETDKKSFSKKWWQIWK